jgi:hypothetical protein
VKSKVLVWSEEKLAADLRGQTRIRSGIISFRIIGVHAVMSDKL